MKKSWITIFLIICMLSLIGCANAAKTSLETGNLPHDTTTPKYSNLDNEESINEVRKILANNGISDKTINKLLVWVSDYNDCMKDCEIFSLAGNFVEMNGTINYGDYYTRSKTWYQNRNYSDVHCRIIAYELNRDNISFEKMLSKEEYDCWDDNNSWLYSDGQMIYGDTEYGDSPFLYLDWNDEDISAFFTLFDPVGIASDCNEEEMYQCIKEKWAEQGIKFQNNKYSLVTLWVQNSQTGKRVCVSHAATLLEMENGFLLFEKTNPTAPYTAIKFYSIENVKQYLYDMVELGYSEFNLPVGKYIILQNDKLI